MESKMMIFLDKAISCPDCNHDIQPNFTKWQFCPKHEAEYCKIEAEEGYEGF